MNLDKRLAWQKFLFTQPQQTAKPKYIYLIMLFDMCDLISRFHFSLLFKAIFY